MWIVRLWSSSEFWQTHALWCILALLWKGTILFICLPLFRYRERKKNVWTDSHVVREQRQPLPPLSCDLIRVCRCFVFPSVCRVLECDPVHYKQKLLPSSVLFITSAWSWKVTFIPNVGPKALNSDLSDCDAFIFAYSLAHAAAFQTNIVINILRSTQPKGTRKVFQGVSLLSVLMGFSQWMLLISSQTVASLTDHPGTVQTISGLWFLPRWKVSFVFCLCFFLPVSPMLFFFLCFLKKQDWCRRDTQGFVLTSQL